MSELKTQNPTHTDQALDKNVKRMAWWVFFISVAYHYKLFACAGLGLGLGLTCICYDQIHGITHNHWFEHLVYVPMMWVALNAVNNVVFSSQDGAELSADRKKLKWVGQFLAVLYVYGHGMHIMNTVEMLARDLNDAQGPLYDQIWWIDEQLSHWMQFIPFFLLMGWYIAHDRLDRTGARNLAVITGVLIGIDRGIGVIEGDNPLLGVLLSCIILVACLYRYKRHHYNFSRAWQDFFFRHSMLFVITIALLLGLYSLIFGLQAQPSNMAYSVVAKVVVLALALIGTELLIVIGLDRKYRGQ